MLPDIDQKQREELTMDSSKADRVDLSIFNDMFGALLTSLDDTQDTDKCDASDGSNLSELASVIRSHLANSPLAAFLASIPDDDSGPDDFGLDDYPMIEQDESESMLAFLDPDDHFSFDAIMEHIFNCSKHHNRTKDEVTRDTFDMVEIGIRRGNVRSDQVERTVCDGGERIKELAFLYKIPSYLISRW